MTEQQTELAQNILTNNINRSGNLGIDEIAIVGYSEGRNVETLMELIRQRHDYFLKITDSFRSKDSRLYVGESGQTQFRTIQNLVTADIETVSFHLYAPEYLSTRLKETFEEASNSGSLHDLYQDEMDGQNIRDFLKQTEEVTIND